MNSQNLRYRPDIDGLRAIAVLSVVAFHAFGPLCPGGFVGVDVFFVISGFLISSVIQKELSSGSFTFFDFFARRARRILPALLLMMTTILCIGWFTLTPIEFRQLGKHALAGAGFVLNFVLWREPLSDKMPFLHLWSLAIEEQFYLIWPVLLAFSWYRGAKIVFVWLAVFVSSLLLNFALFESDSAFAFFLFPTRIWAMALGGILASLSISSGSKTIEFLRTRGNWFALAGLTSIIFSVFSYSLATPYPGFAALLPTLGTSLVIGAGSETWIARNILSKKILVFVGLISYPLYLWHWPLLSLARIIEGQTPSTITRATLVLISFALAYATFQFVEKPLKAVTFRAKQLAVAMICLVAVGLGGLSIYLTNGFKNHRPIEIRTHRLPFLQ